MIVGVCGLGFTGSGAILALLREYDETQVFDGFEFVLSYIPDGLEDLEYHLTQHCCRYYDSDLAIKRYRHYIRSANSKRSELRKITGNKIVALTDAYLDKLTQVTWKGFWSADVTHTDWFSRLWRIRIMERVNRLIFTLTKRNLAIAPNRDMYLSITPEEFLEHSRQYISGILQLMGQDRSKITVLDQPFSGDNPERSFRFFPNPKAIVVDRDPRDLYVFAKCIGSTAARFMPSDDAKAFVSYYRLIRENISENVNSQQVLRVRFEDAIYEYDATRKAIERFIGIRRHTRPRQYFKPEISINNTQLYLRFPHLKADVKCIEDELSEYLYPFDRYGPIVHTGPSF